MADQPQQPAPGGVPTTTIPPFNDQNVFPACAVGCGALYDANGACVPPNAPVANADSYEACFCSHGAVAAFATATAGVCDGACQGDGLSSIANWYRDLCDIDQNDDSNGGNGDTTTTTTTGGTTTTTGGSSSGSGGSNQGGNGGDWLSNHWQWVIMLVVLVVGIGGIWVGACIWRRRYLKKKDRQTTIGQKQSGSASHPSWGPGFDAPSVLSAGNRGSTATTPPTDDPRVKGSFMPGASAAALEEGNSEKPAKKKWSVRNRT